MAGYSGAGEGIDVIQLVSGSHIALGIDRLPPATDLPQPILGVAIPHGRISTFLQAVWDSATVPWVPDPGCKVAACLEGNHIDGDGLRPYHLRLIILANGLLAELVDCVGEFGLFRRALASTMAQNASVFGGGAFGLNSEISSVAR